MAKIGIIGTGAMGSVYAGLLAAAGNEVWAIDVWQEHVDAIESVGLRVEGASGDRVATLRASTRAEDAGICDLVVIATKFADVTEAAKSALALIGSNTNVLTIQNGFGSVERVTAILGSGRVMAGTVGGFGASIVAPGHVKHEGWKFLHIGELVGPITPRVRQVTEIWAKAGFPVEACDDFDRMIWEKFICNVCYSGTCAITGLTIGEVISNPYVWKVASGCAVEAWEVANALGIAVDIESPVSYVRDFGLRIPHARPSMLLDIQAGRRTEIDVINGAVPAQAERVGLGAPYNEVISALVKQREADFK